MQETYTMKRLIILIAAGLAVGSAPAQTLIYNGYNNPNYAYNSNAFFSMYASPSIGFDPAAQRIAFRFTAAASSVPWVLRNVRLPIRTGNASDVYMAIVTDAVGAPGTSIIWQVTAPSGVNATLANRDVAASGLLDPGASYWLMVGNAIPASDNVINWFIATPSLAGTLARSAYNGGTWGSWSIFASSDLGAFAIFADPIATPTTNAIATAVEVFFPTVSGSVYQVQYQNAMGDTNTWYNLGPPILGDGGERAVFDSSRGQTQRYYRVLTQ